MKLFFSAITAFISITAQASTGLLECETYTADAYRQTRVEQTQSQHLSFAQIDQPTKQNPNPQPKVYDVAMMNMPEGYLKVAFQGNGKHDKFISLYSAEEVQQIIRTGKKPYPRWVLQVYAAGKTRNNGANAEFHELVYNGLPEYYAALNPIFLKCTPTAKPNPDRALKFERKVNQMWDRK